MKQSIKRNRRHRPLTTGRALKLSRVVLSLAMFTAMVMMFVFMEGWVAQKLGWVTRIQFFPLVLAGSATGIALWLGATLLFGRIYCSTICPMGVLQDIFIRLGRFTRKRRLRHPFRYEPARNKTRYCLLVAVALSALLGISLIPSLLDPYSAFGRIGSELILPAVDWMRGNPVVVASLTGAAVAVVTLVAVAAIAFMRGRLVCNTVCPVGATLGLFSRWSLFHFDIDTDLCVNCGLCARVCKSSCINLNDHVVDGSRCVTCFDCMDVCEHSALRYTTRRKKLSIPMMQPVKNNPAPSAAEKPEPIKIDRRKFLATGLIVAAAPAVTAASNGVKRIQALDNGGKPLTPSRYVAPPGRRSMTDFLEKCTGCGLCVSRCPSKVLRPSSNEFGWLHALHPVMDFDRSYCRYNCTRCTEVCPTGALMPLIPEEKHIFIIGHAQVEPANCIGCGLCVERCPRKAITLLPPSPGMKARARLVATLDTGNCIGCGACEYICPATPVKAIVVNGIS